jgi:hypothetical protein
VLELIHCFVEVLDKHFGQVCELDIMNDPDVVSAMCSCQCMAYQMMLHLLKMTGLHLLKPSDEQQCMWQPDSSIPHHNAKCSLQSPAVHRGPDKA